MGNLINVLIKVVFAIMVGAFVGMICSGWLVYVPALKVFAVYSGPIFWRTLVSLVFLVIVRKILMMIGVCDDSND